MHMCGVTGTASKIKPGDRTCFETSLWTGEPDPSRVPNRAVAPGPVNAFDAASERIKGCCVLSMKFSCAAEQACASSATTAN